MAKYEFYAAASRGYAAHGWLKSHHTFSFARYYNPERMHFGVLRVLNDDFIEGGEGFGSHPHDNMEIITIPLEGDLAHKDSMGNASVIRQGDIQVMSAGTGVTHSEFNHNPDKAVKLLQIWLFPNQLNVTPRYAQKAIEVQKSVNQFAEILSPVQNDDQIWIHQDAWFSWGQFDAQVEGQYQVKKSGNGVFAFVVEGELEIDGQILKRRDALGIWDTQSFNFKSLSADTKVLLMDIPMELNQ